MSPRPRKIVKRCGMASERSFRHFCENTSIHGVQYIVDEDGHWIERIAWILVFIAGVCFSAYFCWQMWKKWDESPMLTSLETNHYSNNNIMFPAVTICNVNKVSKRKLLQFLNSNRKFNNIAFDKMQDTLRYMTKLDRAINAQEELQRLSQFYKTANITPNDLFEVLKLTSPSCADLILDCSWLGLPKSCLNYFSFLPTDDGICCTFNGANYSDPELGIASNEHEILRTTGNGYRMGLALVLDADTQDYTVTNGKFDGFKVLVHSPEEFADISDRGFVIGPGFETFGAIKTTSIYNTEDVKNSVPINKRGCLVESEKDLKYFTNYSRPACQSECAVDKMVELCKCRPYFFRANKGVPLCDLTSYPCLSDVYEDIRANGEQKCDCPPPCSEIWYDPEISNAPFPGNGFNLTRTFKRLVESLNLEPNADATAYFKSNVAVLHVYFKEKTGVRYQTDVRFGIGDFISAMGGLLGLGMGFSFISMVEILYFMFLRHHVRPLPKENNDDDGVRANSSAEEGPRRLNNNTSTWPSSATVMTNTASPSMASLEMDSTVDQNPSTTTLNRVARQP